MSFLGICFLLYFFKLSAGHGFWTNLQLHFQALRCIYVSCKVLYFILSDDDFEIKSKIYSFNLRLVLKHILHSQDVFFRNLLFTLLF